MIEVQLIKTIKTQSTGVILPAGKIGRVIHVEQGRERSFLFADFGLTTVLTFPVDSDAIRVLGVEPEGMR